VVEVAANDGYLLQYVKARGIPCTGVEPTASTAAAARAKGIDIVEAFFGVDLARTLVAQGKQADLTAANNVLAHVPDINDFVAGFALLLKEQGVATFEFPHLLKLLAETQFDTIYHEHFSYLSLTAVQRVFAANGLAVFDVEELPTHGGSLRVYAQRVDAGKHVTSARVAQVLAAEKSSGMLSAAHYRDFQARTNRIKYELTRFLLDAKRDGKRVAAYGAAAKGNTLLNYAGIRADLIDFVVDRNPAKQDKYMPGSRIPIASEERLKREKPDYVLILPWNLKTELVVQLAYVKDWGGKLVTAIPHLEVA
jgi:SAM-dependent methyltransferase